MKKRSIFAISMIAILLAACTPAQSVSGKYNGSYSGSGMNVNSGSGSLNITGVGDNLVDIAFTSSGNPDFVVNNVLVTKTTILGFTSYGLSFNVYPWSASGTMYEIDHSIDYTLNNDTSIFYVNFDGMKE